MREYERVTEIKSERHRERYRQRGKDRQKERNLLCCDEPLNSVCFFFCFFLLFFDRPTEGHQS